MHLGRIKFFLFKIYLILEDESLLTESGAREQFEIGQRFKSRLGNLLHGPFDPNKFLFKFTHKVCYFNCEHAGLIFKMSFQFSLGLLKVQEALSRQLFQKLKS